MKHLLHSLVKPTHSVQLLLLLALLLLTAGTSLADCNYVFNASTGRAELLCSPAASVVFSIGASDPSTPCVPGNRLFQNSTGDVVKYCGNDFTWHAFASNTGLSDTGSNGLAVRSALNTAISRILAGTTNQIGITNADGVAGNPTYFIANPFTFPGKWTAAAGVVGAASFNIPSGVAPTTPVSGDFWNLSGVLKFYDGSSTHGIAFLDSAPSLHSTSHKNGGTDEIATATPGANAIPKAGAGSLLAMGWLASGTPDGTKFIRDDGTLVVPPINLAQVTSNPAGACTVGVPNQQNTATAGLAKQWVCSGPAGVGAGTWMLTFGSGGGFTIASTLSLIKGDNAGNGVPATAGTDYSKPGTAEANSGDRTNTGKVDNSGATHFLTKVVANVPALPSTGCTAGEMAVVLSATLGQQLYENSGTGTCTWTQQTGGSGSGGAYTTITFSATPTFTGSGGSSNTFLLTLTGNVTSSTLVATTGQVVVLSIVEDATGSRSFVFPTNMVNGCPVNTTALAINTQVFVYDGTNAQRVGPCLVTGLPGGAITLPSPSGGGSFTLAAPTGPVISKITPPAGTTDFSATGGTHQVVRQDSPGAALTVSQLNCADLGDSNTGCSSPSGGGGGTGNGFTPFSALFSGAQVFKPFNVKLDFPNIATSPACAVLSVSYPGVREGDIITVGEPPGLDDQATATARVYDYDTVKVRLCNYTGGAYNAAPFYYVLSAIRRAQ